MFQKFLDTPIDTNYSMPSMQNIDWLKKNSNSTKIEEHPRLVPLHTYRKMGLAGTTATMYTRASVFSKINEVLSLLPNDYQILIFDAFRTVETQKCLFNSIFLQQKKINPHYSLEQLETLTRQFVADPYNSTLFPVLPHNSGGAIDLTLSKNGVPLAMGTAFDEVSPLSATHFFEQDFHAEHGFSREEWSAVRTNRRLLFNGLKQVGLTNYQEEWWHYDLGTYFWKKALGADWCYPSMEG